MTSRLVPVGALNDYLRQLLDGDPVLADIWVEGEISQIFRAQSGHVYFTLRDDSGQIKAALFRTNALRHRSLPAIGAQVAVHGRVGLYPREGTVQLYADVVQPAGLGLAALQIAQLRLRLEADGIFDPGRKRPVPAAPRVIGVVTSADSAVWHDIQHVVRRRYPLTELLLSPTPVQGERAAADVVDALAALQLDGRAEVVIVARGGGPAEDLWAFNDERVVRAVFACRVPVVSGVGHETDWTLVDEAADLRAPTPSAAAELCVPSQIDLTLRLGETHARLDRVAIDTLAVAAAYAERLRSALRRCGPIPAIHTHHRAVNDLVRRAHGANEGRFRTVRHDVVAREALLGALDPRAVLGRGYAVMADAVTNRALSRTGQMRPGQAVVLSLHDGQVAATVNSVSLGSSAPPAMPLGSAAS